MELTLFPSDKQPSKRCPNCSVVKALDDFPNNRATRDGKATYCKPCHNQRIKEIAQRLYGGHANFLRIQRYGIDTEAFQEMIQDQNGKCALCLTKPAKHLDHDHASGKVRAVLCFSCNRGLGKFGDNPLVIRNAIAYLQKSSSS